MKGRVGGWHGRGYLPHFDDLRAVQHVTLHLADSLAAEVRGRLDAELAGLPAGERDAARRRWIERWLDVGYGSCLLREEAAAGLVRDALLAFQGVRYALLAWVVMPNHVHVLMRPLNGWSVARVVASWKRYTGARLGAGVEAKRLWHREYWDRYMRDEGHLMQTVRYIHENPVKAGLVRRAEEWRWSSAYEDANTEIGVPGVGASSGGLG